VTKKSNKSDSCEAKATAWLAKKEIKPFDYLFQQSMFVWISFQVRISDPSIAELVLKKRKM